MTGRRIHVPFLALAIVCLLAAAAPAAAQAASRLRLHGPSALGPGPDLFLQGGIGRGYQPVSPALAVAAGPGGRLLAAWMGQSAPLAAASGSSAGWRPAAPIGSWHAIPQPRSTDSITTALGPAGAALIGWGSYAGYVASWFGVAGIAPGSAGWVEAPVLTAHVGGSPLPALAFDPRGDAYAVWTASLAPASLYPEVVEASIEPAGSGSWEPPVALSSPPPWRVGHLSIGVDERGEAVVMWEAIEQSGAGPSEIEAATYSPGPGWRTPVSLGSGTDPVVAVRAADQALAAWQGLGAGPVQTALLDLSANRWTRPHALAGSGGPKGPLAISIGPRGANAIWWTGNGPSLENQLRAAVNVTGRGTRAGTLASWRTKYLLPAAALEYSLHCVYGAEQLTALGFDRRGGLTAAWTEDCGSVFVSRLAPRARRWGATVNVAPLLGTGAAARPVLAVDERGDIAAVWLTTSPAPGSADTYVPPVVPTELSTTVEAGVLTPGS